MKILGPIICLLFGLVAVIPAIKSVSLVSYYESNKEFIIENFCVNKEKPQLKCDGKCHLASIYQLKLEEKEPEQSSLPIEYLQLFKTDIHALSPQEFVTTQFSYLLDINEERFSHFHRTPSSIFNSIITPPPEFLL